MSARHQLQIQRPLLHRLPQGTKMVGRSLAVLVALALMSGVAQAEDALPKEMEGMQIVEHPGAVIPQGLTFTNQDGKAVTLGSFFDGKRPVLLVMAYYKCPMLCTMVLNGLKDGMKDLAWTAGQEYRVVTVSIDPRDDVQAAHDKRAVYLRSYGKNVGADGWDFLVGTPENVKALADTIGFGFKWLEDRQEYGHSAGAFLITPSGVLSRTLYGIQFSARDLRLGLAEASQGLLGSAWDKVMLFCYHYDPNSKSYVLAATRVMRLGGLVTMLLMGLFLVAMWKREQHRLPRAATQGAR